MESLRKVKPILILLVTLTVISSGCINTRDIAPDLKDTGQEDIENVMENIRGRYPDYNVIIISIDTLRADHLGAYGYERNTSPTIDSIAKEGIVFENTFAVRGLTWPSLTSMLTSLYPVSTNVRTNGQLLNDSFITLPEILKEYNYSSATFLANFCKAGDYGFDSSFCKEKNDSLVTNETLKWLDKNYDRKFFLWVHYMAPHKPYTPPEEYAALLVDSNYMGVYNGSDEQLERVTINKINLTSSDLNHIISLYDGEVRYIDDQVRQIYQKLDSLELLDNSIIIITSDHGEDLYQHNYYFFHAASIYDSTLHIPLIIRLPDKTIVDKRVENVVSNVDVAPTIFDLVNISDIPPFDGKSLVPLLYDPDEGENIALSELGKDIQAIRTPKWKYISRDILPRRLGKNNIYPIDEEELYDIVSDPDETTNVIDQYSEVASSLKKELLIRYRPNKAINETGLPIEADEETKERLRALGYVV